MKRYSRPGGKQSMTPLIMPVAGGSPRMKRESESLREIAKITQVKMTAEEIGIRKTGEGDPLRIEYSAAA